MEGRAAKCVTPGGLGLLSMKVRKSCSKLRGTDPGPIAGNSGSAPIPRAAL
jgi:hypothetical protein